MQLNAWGVYLNRYFIYPIGYNRYIEADGLEALRGKRLTIEFEKI